MAELDIRSKKNIRLGLIGARKNAGLTQLELSNKAFMSRSQLAALELGTRNANDNTWKELKKVLKVKSVEELWERYTYSEGWFIGDDGNKIRDPKHIKLTKVDEDIYDDEEDIS